MNWILSLTQYVLWIQVVQKVRLFLNTVVFYFIYDEYAEIVWNIFMYFMRVRLHISIEYENLALSF